jgi:multimeric flavodoxin WrbA
MNILIINGSARVNGACKFIADELSKKLSLKEGITVTIFSLAEKNIQFCHGCVKCCVDEKVYCFIKDDIHEAHKLVEKADSIVYVSPIYECFIPGILKNFFDRTNYYTSFFKLAGKPMNLILCGAQPLDGETKEFSNRHVVANINDFFKNYSVITHTCYRFLNFFQVTSHRSKKLSCGKEKFEKELDRISKIILLQKIDKQLLESGKNAYIIPEE